jgi:hypothetical protein
VAEDREVQTDEDTALAITVVASDADGDRLAYRIQEPPTKGSLSGTLPDVLYTPDADYYGPDSFVFAVEDGTGGKDTGTVSITIHPADDAPMAMDDEAETSENLSMNIAVLDNDGDPDGEALNVVRVTQGTNGLVVVNGDNTLRYQPNTGFTGLDSLAYTIADGHGGTATATVSVRVHDLADPPVAEP